MKKGPRPVRWLLLIVVLVLVKNEFNVKSENPSDCNGANCKGNKNFKKKVIKNLDLSFQDQKIVPKEILAENADTIEVLNLGENKITEIKLGDFPYMPKLHTLHLHKNKISKVEKSSLDFLPGLKVLRFEDNLMTDIPNINSPLQLYELDMAYNRIVEVKREDLKALSLLQTLIMRGNKIKTLRDETFKYNPKMNELDLSENPLTLMESNSLVGPEKLRTLFLRGTKISNLPSNGLKYLHRLKINEIEEMWTVPEPSAFEALKEVDVTYSVHCCPFRGLHTAEIKPNNVFSCAEYRARLQATTTPTQGTQKTKAKSQTDDFMWALGFTGNNRTANKKPASSSLKYSVDDPDDPFRDLLKSFRKKSNATSPPLCSQNDTIMFVPLSRRVKCRPKPDAFNPCDDVIGTTLLRVFSWASSVFAIFGIANAIMGLYLGILCSLDAFTFGRYYNYVRAWQYSGGCKVAGFLAVFSTELSVCVLAIVTIERYLLIVHALHIRRQMRLIHAKIALTMAWTYSFVVAILPVTDVISCYEKVAICLPFEASSIVSKGYVFWLLTFYLATFLSVVIGYLRMYTSVNGAPPCAGVNTEFKVAKRFSMIVFCNFGCWVPISIAGFLTFFSELPMSIDISKFLLVFAFPLNACTNPFLYAFFTKIFRGDVIKLLTKLGIMKKSSTKFQQRNPSYVQGRHGSRGSEGTVSTSAGNSRFSPPGTLKSVVNGNAKSPNHTYKSCSSSPPVTFQNPRSPPTCYRSLSNDSGENPQATQITVPNDNQQVEKRTGFQSILDGLWALTAGRRNRNESTSSSKELLSSYDPERMNRIRSVSEAVDIASHHERLLDVDEYDIEKNSSPATDITNL